MIKGGVKWKIVDDSNISVWYQPRLHDNSNAFLMSPPIVGTKNMKVANLIVHDNKCQFGGLATVVIIQLGRPIITQCLWHSVDPVLTCAEGSAEAVFNLMERLNKVCMEKFVMGLWMVWWKRNKKCWNDELLSAFKVNRHAKEALVDWIRFRVRTEVTT